MEHGRCASGSGLPAIRDIAHRMGAVLDAPMASVEIEQGRGTRFAGREGGDQIDYLVGRLADFGHGAGELRDLRDKGPGRGKIGIHLGTDFDGVYFGASPSAVNRLGLQTACLRIGKIGRQIGI